MKLRMLSLVMLVTLFSVISASCSKEDKAAAAEAPKPAAQSEKSAINFAFKTLEGADMQLSDFNGKVLIVDLWDTWCPPCRMEIPHFIELQNEYGSQGFEIIGLAFGREGLEAVKKFIADYGVNYTNGMMSQEIMNVLGEISGIPTTFVLNQKGAIHKKYVGYREKAVFENDVRELLGI